MPRYTINDAGYEVTASSPEAAVAADLRAAGYKRARVVDGDVVVGPSEEHLAGVQRVAGAGRVARVTVRVAERRAKRTRAGSMPAVDALLRR